MRSTKQGGWYQKRSFPHFDSPLEFEEAEKIVKDAKKVASHAFWPFIRYIDRKRRFKPKTQKKYENKDREIRYSAHTDGYIFSYYAYLLGSAYETFLTGTALNECVIGYRPRLGTNIDFAEEVFCEIRRRQNCLAIALDIKDFFPTIDHSVLKLGIQKVLNLSRLPTDWYKIFRAMTKFSSVDQEQLAKALGTRPRKFKRPICTASEFRNLRKTVASLVMTNKDPYGIPQGSPISAVMSNVAMIEFDALCASFCADHGAFYRRYSDDIVIVCNTMHGSMIQKSVEDAIAKVSPAMKISPDKTERSEFKVNQYGSLVCDHPFSYLGFTFDGVRVFLRAKTLSRYYRRMTYAGRSAKKAANLTKSSKVFKRKLITQFSHLGKRNFYTYAKRASKKHQDTSPLRQLRRHFSILYEKS